MKSMDRLAVAILKDIGRQYHVDTSKDELTLLSRIREEGQSFITITLPSFEKDLMRSLDDGHISPTFFQGFRRKAGLPVFLQGFLRMLFPDGTVSTTADPALIRSVRQFLLAFKKVERDCTEERVLAAFHQYHDTDSSIPQLSAKEAETLTSYSIKLFGRYFTEVEAQLILELNPRHSGGALATRETFNGRFSSVRWSEKIQKVFPDWDYFYLNPHHMLDVETELDQEGCEPPVRVITVPKTQKTPRIIAMEPVYNQFVQQGIFSCMSDVLNSPQFRPLWEVMCWEDQSMNRNLARMGSRNGSVATLDLSEASDRVSLQHIEAILKPWPTLLSMVMCCRSAVAVTPLGEQRLRKFASMGSSLCFPFETILFSILSYIGMERAFGSAISIKSISPWWRVYGDDIIVPVDSTSSVINTLESYGLKVNTNKSFWKGSFRESCGMDCWRGVNVSVHKLSADIDQSITPIEDLESIVSFRNFLYEEYCYDEAVRVLDGIILRCRYVPTTPSRPLTGISLLGEKGLQKFHKDLHKPVWKVLRLRRVARPDPLDGWGALRKFFLNEGTDPLSKDHLTRDGRSQCVGTSIGWSGLHV